MALRMGRDANSGETMTISEALAKLESVCKENQYMVAAAYNPDAGKLFIGIGAGMAPETEIEAESFESGLIQLAELLDQ